MNDADTSESLKANDLADQLRELEHRVQQLERGVHHADIMKAAFTEYSRGITARIGHLLGG